MVRLAAAILGLAIGSFATFWLVLYSFVLFWKLTDPFRDNVGDFGVVYLARWCAVAGGVIGAIIGLWIVW
jgi:hypothetical protein